MFGLETFLLSGLEILRIKDHQSGSSFEIIPELGGTVYQVRLADPVSGAASPILAPDDPEDLRSNPLFRGRILFPFNDRIPRGRYTFEGKTYQLPVNSPEDGSSIHGLLHDQRMECQLLQVDEARGHLRLAKAVLPDDFPGYPFSVSLTVDYKLENRCFSLNFSIVNRGDQNAPLALGWHPYFRLGKTIDRISLRHGGESYVEVDDSLLPTGRILPVEGTTYDFRNGVLLRDRDLDIALTSDPKGCSFMTADRQSIRLESDPNFFRYTQFYTPGDRRSIAVEPVSAATDSFNRPDLGLIRLNPGEERQASVRLTSISVG